MERKEIYQKVLELFNKEISKIKYTNYNLIESSNTDYTSNFSFTNYNNEPISGSLGVDQFNKIIFIGVDPDIEFTIKFKTIGNFIEFLEIFN